MHKRPIIRISLAVSCAIPLAATAQEGLQLKPQHALGLAPPADPSQLPVFLEADRLRGHSEKEIEAEGNAKLRRGGQSVFADPMKKLIRRRPIKRFSGIVPRQEHELRASQRFEWLGMRGNFHPVGQRCGAGR